MKHQMLPKSLYGEEGIKSFFHHQESSVLFKKVNEDRLNQEKHSESHSFIWIVKGYVEVKTYEGVKIKAHAGDFIFLPRDTYIISDFIREDDRIEMYLVFVGHDITTKFLNSRLDITLDSNKNSTSICKLLPNPLILKYFHALNEIYTGHDYSKSLVEVKILEFLHLLHPKNNSKVVDTLLSSEHIKKRRNIEKIMTANYETELSVTEYAKLSGRSLSSFNREFKRKYNQTPKQWLIQKKMERAKYLLSQGVTVTTCAVELGYTNVSNFIRAFRGIYGVTPSEVKIK